MRVFATSDLHTDYKENFLWIRGEKSDSIAKFQLILQLCSELRVSTTPVRLDGFWIVPLFSWYDGVYDDPEMKAWADFHLCKWPDEVQPLPDYFLRLNEPHLKSYDAPVITFSHFI